MRRAGIRITYLIIWFAVLFGVWMVLVDSLAHPEVGAGPLAAILAAIGAFGVRFAGKRRFRFRLRWLLLLRDTPARALTDTGLLAGVLWRRLVRRERVRGVFRLVRFPPTAADDPEAAAWRAFATAGTSITPNTYVVGIDPERGLALVHQLVPTPPAQLRNSVIGAESEAGASG